MHIPLNANSFLLCINMMSAVVCWLLRRPGARFQRQQRRAPSMGTFILPTELVLLVAANLDALSATSLSLACRRLNSLISPCKLSDIDKERLLLWLEKENATIYFCHHCNKLHSWHGKMGSTTVPHCETSPCHYRGIIHFADRVTLMKFFVIPYYIMRLVMNRHFYGPSHGLPLKVLQREITTHGSGWRSLETLDARIIDNSLVTFSVKMYSSTRRGNVQDFRECLDRHSSDICEHIKIHTYHTHISVRLPELPTEDTSPNFPAPCEQSFRSCPWCMTDYCFEISWNGNAAVRLRCLFGVRLEIADLRLTGAGAIFGSMTRRRCAWITLLDMGWVS